MDNRALFEEALLAIRDPLTPIVEEALKSKWQDRWILELEELRRADAEALANRFGGPNRYEPLPVEEDRIAWEATTLLHAIDLCWDDFRNFFPTGGGARSPLINVRAARNRLYHRTRRNDAWFTDRNTRGALESVVDILSAFEATEAKLNITGKITALDDLAYEKRHPDVQPVDATDEKLISQVPSLLSDKGTHWSSLVAKATTTPALRVVCMASESRALGPIAWKNRLVVPHFAQTDFIRLELDLNLLDIEFELGTDIYCLWLVVDSEQVTCLCPNPELAPDCRVTDSLLTIPARGHEQPLAFYGARGPHSLYVILGGARFSHQLYELLEAPQSIEILDEIAAALSTVPDFQVLRTDFVVE